MTSETLPVSAAPAARSVRIMAPAKVNLVLRVLDRRPDGYHNLWSLMHTVGLEDELCLRLLDEPATVRLHCDDPSLPTDGRNLVVRAATLVLERTQFEGGVEIHLRKRIPAGAGLGGGSSDAAATILGMACLLDVRWSREESERLGQELGSDVSFFFSAPSAVVSGRGENVTPCRLTGERWGVLVHPGFPIETRWAYQRLAESRAGATPLEERLGELEGKQMLRWDDVSPLMANDFEAPLLPSFPALVTVKNMLFRAGAEQALLSGSGSTVFGVFRDEATAVRAALAIGQQPGALAYAVPFSSDSASCQMVSGFGPS